MAIRRLSPYIPFPDGKAAEALALYQNALGAEVATLMHYSEAPPEMDMPAEAAGLVMHAELRIGDEAFMVSDAVEGCPAGGPGQIILDFSDAAAFWGAKFGVLDDGFGVRWSFNCEEAG